MGQKRLTVKKPAQNRIKNTDTTNKTESGINKIYHQIGCSANSLRVTKHCKQGIISQNRKNRQNTGNHQNQKPILLQMFFMESGNNQIKGKERNQRINAEICIGTS